MSVDRTLFFCVKCNNFAFSKEEITHQECVSPFKIVEVGINFKLNRTRLGRITHWFYSLDLGFIFAFTGAVIINAILLPHFNLSLGVSTLESFCLGMVLIRLLKEKT